MSATVNERAVAWSSVDHFYSYTAAPADDPLIVAGGILLGDDELTTRIIDILTPPRAVTDVEVLHPGVKYIYTEKRDTPADVAAAFIEAGGGRTLLDEGGWDALRASGQLGDDDGPEDPPEGDDGGEPLDNEQFFIH